MSEWTVPGAFGAVALGVAVLAGLGLIGSLLLLRRNTRRELRDAQQQQQELAQRLEELERSQSQSQSQSGQGTGDGPHGVVAEFLITDVGTPEPPPTVPARIEGRLFADIVLRETVVKAAGLAHGLRRALSPEHRSRMRFEMRREARRSTKQRKADTKEALREYYARRRAETQTGDVA